MMSDRLWPLWPTRPMLAQVRRNPFKDPNWVFEVKWDGVRCLLHLSPRGVRLQSRNLRDISGTYPELLDVSSAVDARSAVMDGEIVALDSRGRSSFRLLQNRINLSSELDVSRAAARTPVVFYAFDLLHLDGRTLMSDRLENRKSQLERILLPSPRLRYSDHIDEDGTAFYEASREMGTEGVVGKRLGSRYLPGARSSDWVKIRVEERDDFVVGGWTPGKHGRSRYFGSLLLGQYRGGKLCYAGKVGTGFDSALLSSLRRELDVLEIDEMPFDRDPGEPGSHWVRPELVCEVRFADRLDRAMRFPVLLGLRPDKSPREVVCGQAPLKEGMQKSTTSIGRVSLSKPDKLFWPQRGYTKADLFNYYLSVAEYLIPHIRDRPLTLYRQPDGIAGKSFFQRNRPSFAPEWVRSKEIVGENGARINSIQCRDSETLAWLVNMGCIELHPWLSRMDEPGSPDFIVFDLDPVHPAGFGEACRVALVLRDVLLGAGFRTYVKTSGKRGLHVYLPIKRGLTYAQTRSFAAEIGGHMSSKMGALFTMSRRRREKAGRVFFDPAQNGWGRTLAAPYSVRSTPEATVSTPITWEECETCVDPATFHLGSISRRLATLGDVWGDLFNDAQDVHGILGSRSLDQDSPPSRGIDRH